MKKNRFLLCLAVALMLHSVFANADSIENLIDENRLKIDSWISLDQHIDEKASINQQIILYIDVSTPRWFTKGTTIHPLEVQNLIIPPQNTQATNYTERDRGETWSHQRWEVRLFPQQTGKYFIPAIGVDVQVSTEEGNVSGTIYTEPHHFSAQLESGLIHQNSKWFAASVANIQQSIEASSDSLQAGDAIVRTVKINASDTLAMLLPDVIEPLQDKIAHSYEEPNQLFDSVNRGEYQSTRSETVTYMVQTGGEFVLPQIEILWWNTKSKRLETVTLEGGSFPVKHTVSSFIKTYWQALTYSIFSVLLMFFLLRRIRLYYTEHLKPERLLFSEAIKSGNWPLVRNLVYKRLRLKHGALQVLNHKNNSRWSSQAYKFQTDMINSTTSWYLWKEISKNTLPRFGIKKALPALEKFTKKERN